MVNGNDQTSKQIQLTLDELDTSIKQMAEFIGKTTVDIAVMALLCGIIYMLFVSIRRFFRKRLDS